eukprot:TRINITY_DN5986_c0_g1_i1.p1 TRINITY_DN5986_c0_g1~~TRINITY_DN5986_c0_g1_i1.p1  ORF type:complete len:327 (+),score=79.21 TRINITY_DN5986_c0_g1_i1:70-981(+)
MGNWRSRAGTDRPPPLHAPTDDGSQQLYRGNLLKLVLIGDSGVGKTHLLQRFVGKEICIPGNNMLDFCVRTLDSKPPIKLQIWDTAAQERFPTLAHAYYRGIHAFLIVFDITSTHSFNKVEMWLEKVVQYGPEHVSQIIIGNKTDLSDRREVPYETAKEYADSVGVPYIECSARANRNVEQVLRTVVTSLRPTARWARAVLLVGGEELCSDRLDCPLSELGISAESRVEVLATDPAREVRPAAEGGLTIYATAPSLGLSDVVALEVDPDATVGSLLSAFRERYVAPAEQEQGSGRGAPTGGAR